jgi:hypothetical protein
METREAWLVRAVGQVREYVKDATGLDVPEVRVSVGFPHGSRRGALTVIGQCHYATEDGAPALFVTPTINDGARVLDIVLHESLHAALGPKVGHRKAFADAAVACGLAGKPTATVVEEGSALAETIGQWLETLGPYPHAAVYTSWTQVPGGPKKGPDGGPDEGPETSHPKQTTRMLRVACPGCEYTVRTSAKWLRVAIPQCPDSACPEYGQTMMPDEKARKVLGEV